MATLVPGFSYFRWWYIKIGMSTFSPGAGGVIKGVAVGAGVRVAVGTGVLVRVGVAEGLGVAEGSNTSFNTGVGTGDALGEEHAVSGIKSSRKNTPQKAKIR